MSDFVLDASVALAWVLDDPVAKYALDVPDEMLKGKRGAVPAFWHLEVANGLAMAERRGDLDTADIGVALDQIAATAQSRIDTDSKLIPVSEAFRDARGFGLTAYDAAYLSLALREALPLATLDRALRSAARQAGVRLVS